MDGIIIINKPKDNTSHDIVYKVKKMLNEKVGHTGTLDPNATGVLPLLIGKGTLASKYLICHDKVYKVKLKLGVKTTTADGEGEIIEERKINEENLEKEKVEQVLKTFIGKKIQTPPIYSEIKVNGKKLYEYARKGQAVDIPKRQIEIYKIQLLKVNIEEKEIEYIVSCSKGTYIRSLCETIAEKLDTIGYMKDLERLKVGEFDIKNSITIEDLEKNYKNKEWLDQHFITLQKLFQDKENIEIEEKDLKSFLNGVNLKQDKQDGVYNIISNNKYIGTGIIKQGKLKRDIVL